MHKEGYLVKILEDPFFEPRLDQVVRLSVDEEPETLDQIMERINTTYPSETIEWDPFIQFFCRRGALRESEQLVFQYKDLNRENSLFDDEKVKYSFLDDDDDDLEAKKERLKRDLSVKLCTK